MEITMDSLLEIASIRCTYYGRASAEDACQRYD